MLTDYLDDQMNEKEKTRIEEHLESCQKCMGVFYSREESGE